MTNTTKYLIKLKPIDNFFFGGDIGFGDLGDKKNGSYIIKSRYFPQQTAVLGMLRRELLVQEGLLTKKVKGEWVDKTNKEKAIQLVGESQFSILDSQNYGMIKNISPVFIMKGNEKYIPYNLIRDKEEYKSINLIKAPGESFINGKKLEFIPLVNFDNKKGIINFIRSEKEQINFDDVFQEIEQVGNRKEKSEGEKDDNAFYKITAYKFKDNYEFAFILEIDKILKEATILLGGNNSNFKMTVSKTNEDFDSSFEFLKNDNSDEKLILLSDAYITDDVSKYCDFAVTNEISFQNIKSKISKTNQVFEKHEKVFFYEKGSVFFVKKEEKDNFKKILDKEQLQIIGYNKYILGGMNNVQ